MHYPSLDEYLDHCVSLRRSSGTLDDGVTAKFIPVGNRVECLFYRNGRVSRPIVVVSESALNFTLTVDGMNPISFVKVGTSAIDNCQWLLSDILRLSGL